jgi:starch synthase
MRILFASSEVAPFAKTGGLADVSGALPAALARLGHDVRIVMPKYAAVDAQRWGLTPGDEIVVRLAGQESRFILWSGHLPETAPNTTVECGFLANDRLFNRPGLYQEGGKDHPDNLERFSAFSRAVLDVPQAWRWRPDVVHANDWQTALTLLYLRTHTIGGLGREPGVAPPATLFTIHNLAYMGLFPAGQFPLLDLPPRYFTPETLEFYGQVNLLKAGLLYATLLNTVSPTYSREIQTPEFGYGLEGLLRARQRDLSGVINGVDYAEWSPARDPHLPARYDAEDVTGKRTCKRALQKACGLPVKAAPLIGMVTRLTAQKGIDLVLDVLDELLQLDLQLVILGSGDPALERALQQAAKRAPAKLSVHRVFDEPLAHRIEAGADLFLMPSKYEPCGLNQLYSLRYGTIPIVRRTGGLADTVVDATPGNLAAGTATGIVFETASGHALLNAVRLALSLYRQDSVWPRMITSAMAADFSWERSAREYVALYERAIKAAG